MLGYRVIVVLRQMLATVECLEVSIRDITDNEIDTARESLGLILGADDFAIEYTTEAKSGRGPDIVYSKNGKTIRTEPAISTRIKRVSLLPKKKKAKQHKPDGRRTGLGFGARESRELPPDELARRIALYTERANQELDLFG